MELTENRPHMEYRKLSDSMLEKTIHKLQAKKSSRDVSKFSEEDANELKRLNRIKASRAFRQKQKIQKQTIAK